MRLGACEVRAHGTRRRDFRVAWRACVAPYAAQSDTVGEAGRRAAEAREGGRGPCGRRAGHLRAPRSKWQENASPTPKSAAARSLRAAGVGCVRLLPVRCWWHASSCAAADITQRRMT
jgi:hypothetical protein